MKRTSDSRRVLWAVLASIFIHLAIAFSLAGFANRLAPLPEVEEEDKPVELTMVDLATPPPIPKNAQFMPVDQSNSKVPPKNKTFESNADSVAASEIGATGDDFLPSQEGTERTNRDLKSQEASLALEGAQPKPTPPPEQKSTPTPPTTPTPAPSATPETTPSPPPDQLAMLTSTPPPAIKPNELEPTPPEIPSATPEPSPTPKEPASTYRSYQEKTRISGNISNRGTSAVDAVGTPLGRYQKFILDAIGSRWNYYTRKQADLINIGTANVTFSVGRDGRVQNLRITRNSNNEAFANVCLESIQQAKIPPVPQEVADVLPSEGLPMEINFTAFPNQ